MFDKYLNVSWKVILLLFLCSSLKAQEKEFTKEEQLQLDSVVFYTQKFSYDIPPDSIIYYADKANYFCEKLEQWPDFVSILNWKTYAYYIKEEFKIGKKHADFVLIEAKRRLGTSSYQYSDAVSYKALFLNKAGDYKAAIELSLKVIESEKNNKNDAERIALTYKNIGFYYKSMGDFDKALEYHSYAVQIRKENELLKGHGYALDLLSLANCYSEKNKKDTAIVFFNKSLKLLNKEKSSEYVNQTKLDCYHGMAEIYIEKNNETKAITFLKKAQLLLKAKNTFFNNFKTYELYGNLFLKKGAYKKAAENFNKAIEAQKVEFSAYNRHPKIAESISKLGDVYYQKKEFKTALHYYQTALIESSSSFSDTGYKVNPMVTQIIDYKTGFDILIKKSTALYALYLSNKKNVETLSALNETHKKIVELANLMRQEELTQAYKIQLSQALLTVLENAVEVTIILYQNSNDEQFLEDAFFFSESNKAVVLHELKRKQYAIKNANIPDTIIRKEERLRVDLAFYRKKILLEGVKKDNNATEKIARWQKIGFELKREHEQLISQLENNNPAYKKHKYNAPILSFESLKEYLSQNHAALAAFMVGKEKLYSFFITPNTSKVFIHENVVELRQLTYSLKEIISHPPNSTTWKENLQQFSANAHELYTLLFPALSNNKGLNRLIIIPDDFLSYLPFEILISQPVPSTINSYTAKAFSYLFQKHQLSYYNSTSLLLDKSKKASLGYTSNFIGFAPSFSQDTYQSNRACTAGKLYALQCNEEEVENINALLKGSVFTDTSANKVALIQTAGQSRILHFATHVCVNVETPELSTIYLTDESIDYLDVQNLDLNAELVVLSACNTGVGKFIEGEGVFSLTRGFIEGGANSILTSLWAVDDCSTSAIMHHYYKALKKGYPKDEALQSAKLAYIKKADKQNSHPYYWAAFVQIGDLSPIAFDLPYQNVGYYVLLFVVIIMGIFVYKRKG